MNRLKKIIFFAILLIGGLCAMNAQEKTTTAGVPVVKLNNGVEMPRFGLGYLSARLQRNMQAVVSYRFACRLSSH